MMQSSPTSHPSRTIEPIPTSTRLPISQPCRVTECPTVTSSPIRVEKRLVVTWTTQRSWMLLRVPISTSSTSARTTEPNQTLERGPKRTEPITQALSKTTAVGSICAVRSPKGRITGSPRHHNRS